MLKIEQPPFDVVVAWGMGTLAVIVAASWIAQFLKHQRRHAIPVTVMMVALAIIGFAGDRLSIFSRMDLTPAPFAMVGVSILVATVIFGLSPASLSLIRGMSIEHMVALQIFRLPLELIMLRAALLEIMPIEFSMLGYNLDVLTGCSALALWCYMRLSKTVPVTPVRFLNLLGIGFLLAIAALAMMTSPAIRAFGDGAHHINTWILFFPYSLLPWVLVSSAVLGHLLLTRKLLSLPTTGQ